MRPHHKLVALVLLAHGCIVTEPDAWVPPDIDLSETVERIGDAAYQGMCSAFDGYIHDKYRSNLVVKAACTAHALRTTSDATECTAIADDCLAHLPAPVEEDVRSILGQAGCVGLGVARGGCHSPISDLIACLGDLKAELDHVAVSFTCETALDGSVPKDWWRISLPSTCVDVVTRCRR